MEHNSLECLDIRASCERRRKFHALSDIHRSGGKLLDNTGLTSRICSGSLHVDWIDRSLITRRVARFVSVREQRGQKNQDARRRNFAMAASSPRSFANSRNHQTTKEAIARETDTAIDEVDKIYEQELSLLAPDAKITQYLGVLVSKRVRARLRRH
jgi:hypothetical protein